MQITKRPTESDAEFRERAFRLNREHLDPLNEQGRACDPAQVYTEYNETIPGLPRPFVSIGGKHASPMPLPVRKRILMTRLRAICYALGLVFGAALIAVAVFGIGQ